MISTELTPYIDEIGDVFAKWNADGELVCSLLLLDLRHRTDCRVWQRGTFLIGIGSQINKQRDDKGNHVLSIVEDKVVQDIDGTEGTGVSSRPLVEPFLRLNRTNRFGPRKRRSGCMCRPQRSQMHTMSA